MIGSLLSILIAGTQLIVESEDFTVDWPSLDGWDCERDNGRDRIQTFHGSTLKLIRTVNDQPEQVLFDCAGHELGGSKTSHWERGGICEVAWSVSLKLDESDANRASLDVTMNETEMNGYQCVKIASGERA
jgi:hypothetical protein